MKKVLILISILISLSPSIYPGVKRVTVHSRANCAGNNESITWWLGHTRIWRAVSEHLRGGHYIHLVDTGYNDTWRAAAVHWNESWTSYLYVVNGLHYIQMRDGPHAGQRFLTSKTFADDCNIYDGWWDY